MILEFADNGSLLNYVKVARYFPDNIAHFYFY